MQKPIVSSSEARRPKSRVSAGLVPRALSVPGPFPWLVAVLPVAFFLHLSFESASVFTFSFFGRILITLS